jgi:alkylation response protein AidB-like acyl-CoA dehydrogenase
MKRSLIALAAALSMAAAPAMAETSASKLSLASSARTSAQADGANQLEGNLLWIGLAVAAVVALAVFVVFDDDSDSN